MAIIVKPNTFSAGQTIIASQHNSNFDTIYTEFNGSISNDNISNTAAIAGSKLRSFSSIASAAGIIPAINLASGTTGGSKFLESTGNYVSINTGSVSNNGTVNPTNLLTNGDFEVCSATIPDGWLLDGAGAAATRSSTQAKTGTYSLKIVSALATASVYNSDYVTAPILGKGIAYWKSRKVTFGCWVYATDASKARLGFTDGTDTTYSSYHTGAAGWEWLSVTHTVNAAATVMEAFCQVANNNITAYFDGAMLVEGESAFAFSDKPTASIFTSTVASTGSGTVLMASDNSGNSTGWAMLVFANGTSGFVPYWNSISP